MDAQAEEEEVHSSHSGDDQDYQSGRDVAYQALTNHPFFRRFKAEAIANLVSACKRWVTTAPGEVIIQEDAPFDPSRDYIWALTRGAVSVEESHEELGVLESGSVFGDAVALRNADHHPFTIRVKEAPCVVWCVPAPVVLQAIQTSRAGTAAGVEAFSESLERRLLWARAQRLIMLSHCSPNLVNQLGDKLKVTHYKPGKKLWKPGKVLQQMEIVALGTVRITRDSGFRKPSNRRAAFQDADENEVDKPSKPKRSGSAGVSFGDASEPKDEPSKPKQRGSAGLTFSEPGKPKRKGSGIGIAEPSEPMHEPSEPMRRGSAGNGSFEPSQPQRRGSANIAIVEPSKPKRKGSAGIAFSEPSEPEPKESLGIGIVQKQVRSEAEDLGEATEAKEPVPSDDGETGNDAKPSQTSLDDDVDSVQSSSSALTDCESEESESDDWIEDEEEDTGYKLPATLACVEPSTGMVEARAGPHVVVFGEGVILGYEDTSSRELRVEAGKHCIVLSVSKEDFDSVMERAPRETRRFKMLERIQYREWHRCGIFKLRTIDVFSNCSSAFLTDLAQVCVPELAFHGTDIVSFGEVIDGLVLLMYGYADKTTYTDGDRKNHQSVHAPATFGSMQWLGEDEAQKQTPTPRLRAKQVCQVLRIKEEELLGLLVVHPTEVRSMVLQVTKLTGRRITFVASNTGARTPVHPSKASAKSVVSAMWYAPFCEGLEPEFMQELIKQLDCFKLVSNQQVFRSLTGHDADFLVVLTHGIIKTKSTAATGEDKARQKMDADSEVPAPCIVCGFDKSSHVKTTAKQLSEVYRLPLGKCQALAKLFPEETRTFLQRMHSFQDRLEKKSGDQRWWSSLNVLKRHEPFATGSEAFLTRVAPLMEVRFYLPGEVIVTEGEQVSHALFLESGMATIEQQKTGGATSSHDHPGTVEDSYLIGGIGGAFGFAGMQKRAATIAAKTPCKVLSIPIADFLAILQQEPDARQRFRVIAERRLKELVPERLEDHQFFSNFSKPFMNTIRTKCERQVFFAGETIVRQGDHADSMIIISADTDVVLMVDGRKIKEISGGLTIGVRAVLFPAKGMRSASIVTKTACAVKRLTRRDWIDTLKSHAEHRLWIQQFLDRQMQIAEEEARELIMRNNWTKIRARESKAMRAHWDRLRGCDYQPGKAPPRKRLNRLEAQALASKPPATKPKTISKINEESRERWPCFNDKHALMPNTRLPQLRQGPVAGEEDDDDGEELSLDTGPQERQISTCSDSTPVARTHHRPALFEQDSGTPTWAAARTQVFGCLPHVPPGFEVGSRRRSSNMWLRCEDAMGLHPENASANA